MEHRIAVTSDYPVLKDLWERSVRATHDFLQEEDILTIKKQLTEYFKAVNLLVWEEADKIIGFSGTADDKLEMLFLDDQLRGLGYGTKIICYLIDQEQIQTVDVNEANQAAYTFYKKVGFELAGRSEVDDAGRPFPILHLKLEQ